MSYFSLGVWRLFIARMVAELFGLARSKNLTGSGVNLTPRIHNLLSRFHPYVLLSFFDYQYGPAITRRSSAARSGTSSSTRFCPDMKLSRSRRKKLFLLCPSPR